MKLQGQHADSAMSALCTQQLQLPVVHVGLSGAVSTCVYQGSAAKSGGPKQGHILPRFVATLAAGACLSYAYAGVKQAPVCVAARCCSTTLHGLHLVAFACPCSCKVQRAKVHDRLHTVLPCLVRQ